MFLKVLNVRYLSFAAELASGLKIKSYFTLKIPRSSATGSFNIKASIIMEICKKGLLSA
tara:strand:+ start:60 stop:236 length:177 start_codon:yes stop_codon:yes gene_type:complete